MADELNRAAPIAAQLDQDAERAARPSFIQWHQEKFGYCLEGDAAFNDGGRQALTWEVWQAALRAKPAAAQLDAELPPLESLMTYDPERDAPGLMEYRDKYNDGDYCKVEDVRNFVAPYAERIRLLDHEVITQKLVAQVLRDRVAFLESERNLMEANRRAYIDGRTAGTAPDAAPEPKWAGEFKSFPDWVNRAQRALASPSHLPAICVDAKGRRCTIGKDFMLARDEGAFPVRYFWEFAAAPSPQENTK